MADSAEDSNVEDVLSSVRRLVSEEVPRTSRTPVPAGPGALLLTDADRVQGASAAPSEERSLEQRIADLEAAVDRRDEEFEPDGSEDQSLHIPDRIVYTRPPSSSEEAEMRGTLRLTEIALIQNAPTEAEDDTLADDEDMVSSVAFRSVSNEREKTARSDIERNVRKIAEAQAADEAPMAEDVPTEPARRATVTAFTNPDDVVERIEARIKQSVPPAVEPLVLPRSSETIHPQNTEDFDAALTAAVKASVSEALQSDLGHKPDPAEDDPRAEAGDTLPAASQDIAPVAPDPAPANPEPPTTAAGAMPEESVPAGDRDALRTLVGELIREELQGPLGERITHNVRKLVRREIKRALAARDLS